MHVSDVSKAVFRTTVSSNLSTVSDSLYLIAAGTHGPNRLHLVMLKRPLSVVFSRLSCRLSASTSECLFGLFSFIFEDLSGLFVIISFVIHQVALEGIGVPFRVGFSRLDLMFNYLRFCFRYRPISSLRSNMLLPLLLRSFFH